MNRPRCAFLLLAGLALTLMPPPATAVPGNATLEIEVSGNPRTGEEVRFFLHFFDPDPSSYPYMRCIDFGDGLAQCIHAHPVPCTEPVTWGENVGATVVPALRSDEGFPYVYERPGFYQVHASVFADEGVCGIYPFHDEAEALVIVSVRAG